MEIVRKQNRYFLQFDAGELELTEQQVQKRLERGDKVMDQLQKLQDTLPDIETTIEMQSSSSKIDNDFTFSPQYNSAKYFEYIFNEFKEIYKANRDNPDTIKKLVRFCKNSILKLEDDRKSPRTDHVVIDFYILSWHRVISYLDALPKAVEQEAIENATQTTPEIQPSPVEKIIPTEKATVVNTPPPTESKDYTKQLLIIQLMQADGIFPINNALEGVTQSDIHRLIAGVLGTDETTVRQALHSAASILMKRNMTTENIPDRIRILEEVEAHFETLPYNDIISRVKLLLKIYREKL